MKKQLRLKFKNWMKENVSIESSLKYGQIITQKLSKSISSSVNKPNVSVFISKFPEISTAHLIDYLYTIGANVYIPAWNSNEMWMCHIESRVEYQKLIDEAPSNTIPMPRYNIIPISDVFYDFIIIPGLCFDKNCHRLGYGYGHYDYFLSKYFESIKESHKTRLIGIGFDEQIYEESLPFEEHDIQLHQVLTPSYTLRANVE